MSSKVSAEHGKMVEENLSMKPAVPEPNASHRNFQLMAEKRIYDPALQAPPLPPQRVWFPPPPLWVGVGPAPFCGWGVCVGVWCGAPCFWMDPTHLGGGRHAAGGRDHIFNLFLIPKYVRYLQ